MILEIMRVIYNSFTTVNNNVEHKKTITMNFVIAQRERIIQKEVSHNINIWKASIQCDSNTYNTVNSTKISYEMK